MTPMLRRSPTATIEKNKTYTASFDTDPYECGWASEATWFIRMIELGEGTSMKGYPQISPDGLFECDKEGAIPSRFRNQPFSVVRYVTSGAACGFGAS